jgi:hypothetical protein
MTFAQAEQPVGFLSSFDLVIWEGANAGKINPTPVSRDLASSSSIRCVDATEEVMG